MMCCTLSNRVSKISRYSISCGGQKETEYVFSKSWITSPLPKEILLKIFSKLQGEGLGGVLSASLVCKDWHRIVEDAGDYLWKDVFEGRFGQESAHRSLCPQDCGVSSWKSMYRDYLLSGLNWMAGECSHWYIPDEDIVDAQQEAMATSDGPGSNVCYVTVEESTLVLGTFQGDLHVWDLDTRSKIASLKAHTGYIQSISISPCGSFIFSASEDKTARAWSLKTGKCTAVMEHTEACAEVWYVDGNGCDWLRAFSSMQNKLARAYEGNGEKLFVVTATHLLDEEEDAEFLLWELSALDLKNDRPNHGRIIKRFVGAQMFDQQTGVLAMSGTQKQNLQLVHVLTGEKIAEIRLSVQGKIKDVFFGHSQHNGWQLIVGSDQREVEVIDITTRGKVSSFCYSAAEEMTMFSLNEHIFCLTSSLQQNTTVSHVAGFRVWDALKGVRIGDVLEVEVLGSTPCDALQFDIQQAGKSNVTVVLAGADGHIILWTLPSGEKKVLEWSLSMGENGYLVAESNWRWLAVRDHSGVHIFDFLSSAQATTCLHKITKDIQ